MTAITVKPARDDLPFGARVRGVTYDGLQDAGLRAQIKELFEEHGVLILEGVDPSPKLQVAVSNVIGPLKDHPSQAVPRAGATTCSASSSYATSRTSRARSCSTVSCSRTWLPWHFDHCYNDQLNRAGVLRAIEVPPDGGRTGFVDGIALYDAISPRCGI